MKKEIKRKPKGFFTSPIMKKDKERYKKYLVSTIREMETRG